MLRCICRCVPSPQSNSIFTPPRCTSTAAVERRAEGADAPVPRKVTVRSTRASLRNCALRGCRSGGGNESRQPLGGPTVDLVVGSHADAAALVVAGGFEAQASLARP